MTHDHSIGRRIDAVLNIDTAAMASQMKNTSAAVSHSAARVVEFARMLVTSTNLEQPRVGVMAEDRSRTKG